MLHQLEDVLNSKDLKNSRQLLGYYSWVFLVEVSDVKINKQLFTLTNGCEIMIETTCTLSCARGLFTIITLESLLTLNILLFALNPFLGFSNVINLSSLEDLFLFIRKVMEFSIILMLVLMALSILFWKSTTTLFLDVPVIPSWCWWSARFLRALIRSM